MVLVMQNQKEKQEKRLKQGMKNFNSSFKEKNQLVMMILLLVILKKSRHNLNGTKA